MQELQIFSFENNSIQTIVKDQEIYFRATPLAQILKYSNPHDAIKTHVDIDDLVKHEVVNVVGKKQKVNFVNESGMYALIFGSKLDTAKKFKKWVTSEVLPSIRKTGRYSATPSRAPNELSTREIYELGVAIKSMRQVAELILEIEPALTILQSRYAGRAYDTGPEFYYRAKDCILPIIERNKKPFAFGMQEEFINNFKLV